MVSIIILLWLFFKFIIFIIPSIVCALTSTLMTLESYETTPLKFSRLFRKS
jgi:hypothetical protein